MVRKVTEPSIFSTLSSMSTTVMWPSCQSSETAGRPPLALHSMVVRSPARNSTSPPPRMCGGPEGMATRRRAEEERRAGVAGPATTWHWYSPSSSIWAARILRFQSLPGSPPTWEARQV